MDENLFVSTSDPAEGTATTPAPQGESTRPADPDGGTADTPAEPPAPSAEKSPQPAQAGPPAPAFTVPVKYNKQYRELTPEEAGVLAQKGMKYDALEPQLQKLRQMAAISGRSLSQMVDSIYQAGEALARQELLRRTGGDAALADQLMEARKLKGDKAFADALAAEQRDAQADRADTTRRLADDFLELQREFPDIARLDDIPDPVLEAAARKGTSLTAEYLLFRHREEQRIARARADGKTAGDAAVGSMQDFGSSDGTPALSAMLKAIWE